MRQGDGVTELVEPLLGIITRLHGVGEATVDLLAPDAPVAVKDEAVIRYASYLYDQPSGTSGDRYAAAWRNSGAGALVAGWVIRRVAGSVVAVSEGAGVSETRINQLIEAAIQVHTDIVEAHHTPGTGGVIDEDAVRQIVRDAISIGEVRGVEFARTPNLPTAATTASINVNFIIGAMAPTGTQVDGNLTRLPHIRPSPDIIGVWAVALVGDVETDETFIPWGGGGIEEEKDSINEFGYHGLSFTPAGSSGDRYLDVVTAHRRGSFWSLNLEGDGDTLPADSTVRFFLAVASGVTVEAGGTPVPGDGLGMAAVLALIADHTGLSEAHHVPGTGGGADTVARAAAAAVATNLQQALIGLSISGNTLSASRQGGGAAASVMIPTGMAVADGVIVSATVNVGAESVTVTTSTGSTVVWDLTAILDAVRALITTAQTAAEAAQNAITTHTSSHPSGLPAGTSQLRELKWNPNTSVWEAVSGVEAVYYGAVALSDYAHVAAALAAGLNTADRQIEGQTFLLYKGLILS